jgi:ketosteroid isomerase-like protein
MTTVTEDDIAVLLGGYEAWNRGEVDAVLELVDPEIEWRPGFGALEAGTHRGAEGFREFTESWLESFDDFSIEPELIVQKDETVIVVALQHARGRGSGIELDAKVVHVWTVREGKAVAWWGPRTLQEALDALGDPRVGKLLFGYETFNAGEVERSDELFDDDVVWNTWIVPGPGGGTYRGIDGVRELWNDARNVFGDFRNEPERLIFAGDQAVAFVKVCGTGKGSGVEVEAHIAHLFTFRSDKVMRVDSYQEQSDALRAVGLA